MQIEFNDIKKILIIIVILFVIDVPMLTYFNKDMYQANLKGINNGELDFSGLKIVSAIICYLIMGFGIYYFSVKEKNLMNALILGFVVYGVYNTTNFATMNKYSLKVSIIDTVWGTILFTLVSYLTMKLF